MSALCLLHLTILRSILVTVRNLLDEVDDALPQPAFLICMNALTSVGLSEVERKLDTQAVRTSGAV